MKLFDQYLVIYLLKFVLTISFSKAHTWVLMSQLYAFQYASHYLPNMY